MPSPRRKKPGRPPFQATPARRRAVEEMLASGMKQEQIARAIGCSHVTLRERFGDELDNAIARKRREVVQMLFKSARAGNVSAQKHLEALIAREAAETEFTAPETKAPVATVAPRGKKEIAAELAKTAGVGTDWGEDLGSGRMN